MGLSGLLQLIQLGDNDRMNSSKSLTRIVSGDRVFDILVDKSKAPRGQEVTILSDSGDRWNYEVSGWAPIGYGIADDNLLVWSARQVIVVRKRLNGPVIGFVSDEDIYYVFTIDGRLLVVCETSVHLVEGGKAVSRKDLSDSVKRVQLRGNRLTIAGVSGSRFEVEVSTSGLNAPATG